MGAGQGLARCLVRVNAAKAKDLCLVPGSHIMERKEQANSYRLLSVLHTCTVVTPPYPYTQTNVKQMLLTEIKLVKSSINALYIKNSRKLPICVYVDTFKFNKTCLAFITLRG